jgi:predicted pyridoxine 5'-phosphate oxidase superfamily flavin-nucleotide-binding protein
MKISKNLKKVIEGNILAFSTVGKGNAPHTIYVACVKIIEGSKLLVSDNYMKETVKNLKRNRRVVFALVAGGKGIELRGAAKYFTNGKYYELVKKLPENKGMPRKGAIVVFISKIKKMA